MKNFEGEKSHFGDLFEGMKDINFPENITTPKEIMEKFQHWLQEPSLHDTIQDAIKQYQNKWLSSILKGCWINQGFSQNLLM